MYLTKYYILTVCILKSISVMHTYLPKFNNKVNIANYVMRSTDAFLEYSDETKLKIQAPNITIYFNIIT